MPNWRDRVFRLLILPLIRAVVPHGTEPLGVEVGFCYETTWVGVYLPDKRHMIITDMGDMYQIDYRTENDDVIRTETVTTVGDVLQLAQQYTQV